MTDWIDHECYYIDCIDAGRVALVAGPYRTLDEAEADRSAVQELAYKVDDRSWFYLWGTCKVINGHRSGVLNDKINPYSWTGYAQTRAQRPAGNTIANV